MIGGGLQFPRNLPFSSSIAAGATFNPLTDWQYETPMEDCDIELIQRATATGLVGTLTSGGDTVLQEAPVPAGGTAGQTPARINVEPVVGHGHAGQKIRLAYRNPTAGAITIDGIIIVSPKRMGRLGRSGGGYGGGRRPPRRLVGGLAALRRRRK